MVVDVVLGRASRLIARVGRKPVALGVFLVGCLLAVLVLEPGLLRG